MLTIKSRSHRYGVLPANNLAAAAAAGCAERASVFALVDGNVARLYAAQLRGLDPARTFRVTADEAHKSYEAIAPLFRRLIAGGFRKDCGLLVIGGGVVQDIGCFIASVLLRGSYWELVPTTLLAQCDSCIGSKSSINVAGFKNQLGTFYPPHRVHLVASVLKTLPPDEIRSGIGEMVKLALVSGPRDWARLRRDLQAYRNWKSERALEKMVLDSLAIKKRYIEKDEFDRGIRNLLNYGHTFGHAFESATDYGIPHGIAVLLGMGAATFVSERLGLTAAGSLAELDGDFRPYYAPFDRKLRRTPAEKILAAMKLDKKNAGGKINCILTRGPGRMEKVGLEAGTLQPLVKDYLLRLS